jgi:hypothetical protein
MGEDGRGPAMRSKAGWDLPPDGEAAIVAGVRLPAGRRLAAEGAEQTPVLWATGEFGDAAAAWLALNERLAGTRLVPVLLAVVGWTGAMNYHATPAPLACVLRSWEDRFGARLVHLGFDTMDLLVERPAPSYKAAGQRIAAWPGEGG